MGIDNTELIAGEIKAQLAHLELILAKLLERDAQLARGESVIFEGAAYHIHNYYSATEDLLKIVAAAFENNIEDASRWHSELINRMKLDIEGVRPRLLSDETAILLHRLRSFRHFFRHAYRVDLDGAEIQANVARVQQVHPLLLSDAGRFLAAIGQA